jgi:hypothetical protein
VTSIPVAHVGGIPIEETFASFAPAVVLFAGMASARLRALVRNRQRR